MNRHEGIEPSEAPGARDLDAILAGVTEHADDFASDLIAKLAHAAYRRAPADLLGALDPRQVARRMVEAAHFISARRSGEIALRLRDPPEDEGGGGTVVEISSEDSPFLVSTVNEELKRLGLEVVEIVHPVIGVEWNDEGRLAAVGPARGAEDRESYMRLALGERVPRERRDEILARLQRVLRDAKAVTQDFAAMLRQLDEIAYQTRAKGGAAYGLDEVDETCAFIDWLADDHFVLLGYREYDLYDKPGVGRVATVARGTGLGLLADEERSRYADPVALDELPPSVAAHAEQGTLLTISRTNSMSTVHRRARMMYVGVKKLADDGAVTGEYRFIGLLTQKAFSEPASDIPVVRRKLEQILAAEDVVEHSYDDRALRSLFEALPKHELFEVDPAYLRRSLVGLLQAQQRGHIRVLLRADEERRTLSVLVTLPRERFNSLIRQQIQHLLVERFAAISVDYHLSITEGDQTLLHFLLHVRDELPEHTPEAIEEAVIALARDWKEELAEALVAAHGPEEGHRLAKTFAARFPAGYSATVSPLEAVGDITHLDLLLRAETEETDRLEFLQRPGEVLARVKLFKIGAGVELSSFLPTLESLGLVVVEEVPHRLSGVDVVGVMQVHDFGVRTKDSDATLDVARDGGRLADAALAIWHGKAEADSLNELVLVAGLNWQEVAILRAYRRYRRQVGTSFTETYLNQALLEHPRVGRALVELFAARFDPERNADEEEIEHARAAVDDALEDVERLDQDRILRGWLGLIEGTVRTNRYVPGAPRPFLSLKLDPQAVPDMPKPVPFAEIFVYSPQMEAIHLRGGPVARGGLRWSDRQEDFRTEILGLMKAQMVKNAIIVPTGAKGGFVLKRPPIHPGALREQVRRCYRDFIRGMLDLTDNVVDDAIVAPPGVRRWDGDDPYLVVAADKGTATFSDVANELSARYGFWLGDAFASGGSRGYDHKALGITARGAWVAVRRHFRELGVDVQHEPVKVVGIGDMSGDVFGNGLLQSRAVKLVAAFDHRHIFLDPDPDPERAFAERLRLSTLARSSWQDYNRVCISEGGGVWSRTAKTVPLSPQVRELLGVEVEELSPPEVVKAALRAASDLLFAGGIGTFVKASIEQHADVGDRANDAIRVDADELGARVVAEGGNLALTQRARIQYARRGGRCNTDAIDNAAGVDTSDREVNIKILLRAAQDREGLDDDGRDELLVTMAEEVAARVLRDVYLQAGTITQELEPSSEHMEAYESLMAELGRLGRLDRQVEHLPLSEEMRRRREAGAGLTRPELAVLLGYAKAHLADVLEGSDVPDQPAFADPLRAYFPAAAVDRYGHLLEAHRLRRELVATIVANDLVNRMGITYATRTSAELGREPAAVAACYWIAREVTGADELWRAIERLDDRAEPELQRELMGYVGRLVDAGARRYLRWAQAGDVAGAIERDRKAFLDLERVIDELGSRERRAKRAARIARFTDLGIDEGLAARVVGAAELAFLPEVAAVARQSARGVRHVAEVFLRVGDALPLGTVQQHLDAVEPRGHWQRWQQRQLEDELRDIRRSAAARAVTEHPEAPAVEAVAAFLGDCAGDCERALRLVARLERERDGGLPAVAVAVRALREALAPAG